VAHNVVARFNFLIKRAIALSLVAAAALSFGSALASDWVEGPGDQKTVFQVNPQDYAAPPQTAPQMAPATAPPIAPPRQKPGGGMILQGGATTFGAAGQTQRPSYAANVGASAASLGADADRFLMGARTDTNVPPSQFRGWLEKTHPEFNLSAQRSGNAVIEVKGAWDNSAEILEALGIRYQRVKGRELRGMPLDGTKVMVVNCDGRLPRETFQAINTWVARGGYLITTDWALNELIEKAFPGNIAWNGEQTDGSVVDALIVGPDPSRFQGANVGRATWKLDRESQMVKILNPRNVRVLARSYKLAKRDPNRVNHLDPDPNHWGILAVEFKHGRGRVLHLVGHYDYNSPTFRKYTLPDAIPGVGIGLRQAIATNFLVEGIGR
jgi:hypothetical protein